MTASPPLPRRRRRALLAGFLVLLLAGGGYFGWRQYAAPHDDAGRYQSAEATRGDIEDVVTATGTLQPLDFVDVGAQVSGQLKKIHVEVGSVVKAGDLLAEIDPVVLQTRVDATRAQLRNLRAQLIDREAARTLAGLKLARERRLMVEDATSAEALQTAEASQQSAAAQVEALKAQIEQTESNLRADEANLNYARIYAPIAGTVVSITARQGQTLIAAQQAPVLLRVANLDTMTVQTQVSEADVTRLRLGMDAYFTTLGGDGRRWTGKLRKIEPTPVVQNNVVLYNALFDVANPRQVLMTQMTAQVFFVVAAAPDAVLVPMSAAVPQRGRGRGAPAGGKTEQGKAEAGGKAAGASAGPSAGASAPRRATIKVIADDGSVSEREVELGVGNRVQVQVLSGLKAGERVVTGLSGVDKPTAGTPPRRPPRL